MRVRQFFLAIAMLCVGIIFCAEANLIVDHQVSPSQIYSLDSGRDIIESTVRLTLIGEMPEVKSIPVRAVLAIDSSGSMEQTDSENHRISAAKNFVNMMNSSQDLVGVVSWDDNINFVLPLTDNFTEAISKIDEIGSKDGTNLDVGLKAAVDLLAEDSGASKVIVFLTDGNGEYTPCIMPGSQADRARSEGIVIYSIGLNVGGTDAEDCLNDMATATGGEYYDAPESESLEFVYEEISKKVMNVAGRDVNVNYVIPADFISQGYSAEPNSNISEGDTRVLTWNLGAISIGESQELFFNVSSLNKGIFDLGGPGSVVTYTRYDGKPDSREIESNSLTVNGGFAFKSGISVESDRVSSEVINKFYESLSRSHDIVEHDDNHVVWIFTNTGDWGYVFADGRMFVASTSELSLYKKDVLEDTLRDDILSRLVAYGYEMTGSPDSKMEYASYYAKDVGIYHRIKYDFSGNFDMYLEVPHCTVEEARLKVVGYEWSGYDYIIDGKYVASSIYSGETFTVDITKDIPTGRHDVSGKHISNSHTMLIEAITSPILLPKQFVLHNDPNTIEIIELTKSLDLIALETFLGAPIALDLVSDKSSPQSAGSKITWTAKAYDLQEDTIYYRFWLTGPATGKEWEIMQDWSTNNTWTWETSESDVGSSNMCVWTRDDHIDPDTMVSYYQWRAFEIVG